MCGEETTGSGGYRVPARGVNSVLSGVVECSRLVYVRLRSRGVEKSKVERREDESRRGTIDALAVVRIAQKRAIQDMARRC